jgi:cell wall-associated NlpC family hydrolase
MKNSRHAMSGHASAVLPAWLSFATVGLVLIALSGCATAPRQIDQDSSAGIKADVGTDAVQHALGMVGTPYRYGGSTPQGFDCSGLVQYSYARAGIELPRSMEGLWTNSHPVSAGQIRPGDLLFFHQEGKLNSHVGLYIGEDRFVHAPSTGKQVSIASLANRYWRQHFSVARRPFTVQPEGSL